MNGIGGAVITLAIVDSSSGAASASATKPAITSGVAGRISMPPTIWRARGGGTGAGSRRRSCRRRRGSPRTGPGASRRPTCSSSPSAVTTSAAIRSSIVRPCLRTRNPTPPPSVIPPMPTEPVSPKPVARPCSPAAAVYSPAVSPVPAHAVRASTSISRPHPREVEHDPAFGDAVTRGAVPAAANGELQPGLARERDHARDVVGVRRPDDRRGPPVDRPVEDGPRARRSRDRRGRRPIP